MGSVTFALDRTSMTQFRPIQLVLAYVLMAILIFGPPVALAGDPHPQAQGAQQPSQGQQQPSGNFAITATVPLVNVDVVVTDNDGHYLNGLTKENFRITEDGAS